MTIKVSAVVSHESPWWVARCVEAEVSSQGTSEQEALENLKDAVEAYLKAEPILTLDEPPRLEEIEVGS
ncbi:type II toxin-antitoxin system HicB family antitoxin [Streptomyces hiroshimensis]|uniref:Type II toxin-antitoxin system HicB family antitoxin n=1 Tax=Streptomyces hiroshimensis TaxID=66424 RepID=A0ABQ2YG77_9ACTN|nr:type II toxin-antitoxin system HicB family antitoxin [Streptomyces hiroshimensis]GGX82617.1 hypothetical protein GCM10010324_30310 [Streptomyces hiroshimensis]